LTRSPRPPRRKPKITTVLNAEYINERRGRFYEGRDGKLWFISENLTVLEEKDGKISFEKIELNFPLKFDEEFGNYRISASAGRKFLDCFDAGRYAPTARRTLNFLQS